MTKASRRRRERITFCLAMLAVTFASWWSEASARVADPTGSDVAIWRLCD